MSVRAHHMDETGGGGGGRRGANIGVDEKEEEGGLERERRWEGVWRGVLGGEWKWARM